MAGMLPDATRERLETWIADFCEGDGIVSLPAAVREPAAPVLMAWMEAACGRHGREPDDLEADDLREGLLGTVARLDLGAAAHGAVPDLCRAFLEDLERGGRLADGRDLGLTMTAARPSYERAVRGEPEPIDRPGPKVGRNDPCPCGSGKKFKRCCLVR